MELRKYQIEAIDNLRASLHRGNKRPLLVFPTGSGKSPIFSQIAKSTADNGKRILFLVHKRNLIFQMSETLKSHFGITPGIIMAGVSSNLDEPVQLASIQTYKRRLELDELIINRFFIDADVILIDECHRAVSKSFTDIINLYKDKIIIGCTATPARADGRGLGEVFDDLVIGPGVGELTDQGYLCPVRYFVPGRIDLNGVKMSMGDYQVKALADKTINKKLIGDIVQNWLKLAENRKTLVFCVNVKHAIAVCEAFQDAGIKAAHLNARSSDDERQDVFDKMERGDITVLCNVLLYVEGLDVPSIGCIVMARPTKSMGLYRQSGGRGLRVEKGKENLLYLDHANVIETHGLLDLEIEWTLDGNEKAFVKPTKKQTKKLVRCRACGLTFEGSGVCPDCYTEVISFGKKIETINAELEELAVKSKNKENRGMSWADKIRLMGALVWQAEKKGYKSGWAAHSYKDYTGVWPNDRRVNDIQAIKPEGHIANLLKYILIKKAKSYKKGLDRSI